MTKKLVWVRSRINGKVKEIGVMWWEPKSEVPKCSP